MKEKTPYEYGYEYGQWTDIQIESAGFTNAEECLQFQEAWYQKQYDELLDMYQKNPEYAKLHVEFIEGIIAGARSSLQGR